MNQSELQAITLKRGKNRVHMVQLVLLFHWSKKLVRHY